MNGQVVSLDDYRQLRRLCNPFTLDDLLATLDGNTAMLEDANRINDEIADAVRALGGDVA